MAVRLKPCVNTGNVEPVLAFGQDPTRFPLLELRQAHRAFRRGFLIPRFEDECGERVDGVGIEALRNEDGGGRSGGRGGEAAESGAAAAAPAGVDVESDNDEAGGEEDGDGGNHDFALEGVPD